MHAGEISAVVQSIRYETYDNPVPLDLMKGGGLFNDMPFTLETALLLPEATFYHSETGEDLAVVSTAFTIALIKVSIRRHIVRVLED